MLLVFSVSSVVRIAFRFGPLSLLICSFNVVRLLFCLAVTPVFADR